MPWLAGGAFLLLGAGAERFRRVSRRGQADVTPHPPVVLADATDYRPDGGRSLIST
jgi:hypothetical protein